jgi:hypothetical protein
MDHRADQPGETAPGEPNQPQRTELDGHSTAGQMDGLHLLAQYLGLNDEQRRIFHQGALNPGRFGFDPSVREKQAGNGHLPENGQPADSWQAFTLADAYQERPPLAYIAAGLFALPSLNIVYGAPGTLKSFLLADLATCAAGGFYWLEPAAWVNGNQARGIPTRQVPVMWVDYDNGRRRTLDRFGALGRAREMDADLPLYIHTMDDPWLNASERHSLQSLARRMLDRQVQLLVVDNLGVVSGDADENSGEMVRVMSGFRQLAEATGAAVVLIHHQRKSTGASSRAGDSLRGHSSIEAALDLALLIEREELADTVNIRATKVRGADVLPFSAVFTHENRPDGELHNARFFGIAADDNSSDAAIEREILLVLSGKTLNKTELTRAVKSELPEVGINRIRDRIDRLAATARLNISSGKNNTEKLYSKAG